MSGVRIDKWVWAARFFKTRALAVKACELGRITANGVQAKASRDVKVGDKLLVKNDGGEFEVEVLELSQVRGPASVAQGLYRETEESKDRRRKLAEEKKDMPVFDEWRDGRPTKRDRRRLENLRGRH